MRRALVVGLLIAVCARGVAAQYASLGVRAESYGMSQADRVRVHDVQVLSLLATASYPLSSWGVATVRGGYASASITLPSGEEADARGPVDTELRVELARGHVSIAGLAIVPTGEAVPNLEEATAAGVVSSGLLPFDLIPWGTGGALGGEVGYELDFSRGRLLVTGGYILAREFEVLGGDGGTYLPGSQSRVRGLIDVGAGEAGAFSLLIGLQRYGTDSYEDYDLFDPGLRIETAASYAFPFGSRESALIFARFLSRAVASVDRGIPVDRGEILSGISAPLSRQLLMVGSELRISRGRLDLVPRGELRVLRSAEGIGQGWLGSVGGQAEYRLRGGRFEPRLIVVPSAALRVGRTVPEEGAESGFMGWEAGLAVRWEG